MKSYEVVVEKSAGMLSLFEDGRQVMRVRACTGREPGPKKAEGDLRTPEGAYRICCRNRESDYHLSLAIDYPGRHDAEGALQEERIDRAAYERIMAAHDAGETPPWDTPLGGEIFIHGEGTDREWTLGCVKVSNADIERLFGLLPVGTPVVIRA